VAVQDADASAAATSCLSLLLDVEEQLLEEQLVEFFTNRRAGGLMGSWDAASLNA